MQALLHDGGCPGGAHRRPEDDSSLAAALYEYIAYNTVTKDGACGWGQGELDDLRFIASLPDAAHVFGEVAATSYEDCHAWYFTPSSFRLVMLELRALGFIRMEVESISEAVGCEFFVRMKVGDGAAVPVDDATRLALLVTIMAEHADQFSKMSLALWSQMVAALSPGHPVPMGPQPYVAPVPVVVAPEPVAPVVREPTLREFMGTWSRQQVKKAFERIYPG